MSNKGIASLVGGTETPYILQIKDRSFVVICLIDLIWLSFFRISGLRQSTGRFQPRGCILPTCGPTRWIYTHLCVQTVTTKKRTDRLWSWWSPAWGRWTVWGRPCRWEWGGRGRHHLQLSGCSGSPWNLWRSLRRNLNTRRTFRKSSRSERLIQSARSVVRLPQVSTRTSCSSTLLTATSELSTTSSPVSGWLITQLVASKWPLMRNFGSELLWRHKASSSCHYGFE